MSKDLIQILAESIRAKVHEAGEVDRIALATEHGMSDWRSRFDSCTGHHQQKETSKCRYQKHTR